MNLSQIIRAVVMLWWLPFAVSSDTHFDVLGTAFDPQTREVLYYEHHFYPAPDEHQVQYISVDGQPFGNKELSYRLNNIRPEVFQQNQWAGEQIRITYENVMEVKLGYKKNQNKPMSQAQIPITRNLVVDAGFDPFVRQYWTELMSDESLEFEYLAPSKGRVIPLKIEKISSEQFPLISFQISAKQWLINLIMPPIMLTYDEYQRLIRFEGTSNIANSNGRYLNVDLQFQYFSPLG